MTEQVFDTRVVTKVTVSSPTVECVYCTRTYPTITAQQKRWMINLRGSIACGHCRLHPKAGLYAGPWRLIKADQP